MVIPTLFSVGRQPSGRPEKSLLAFHLVDQFADVFHLEYSNIGQDESLGLSSPARLEE